MPSLSGKFFSFLVLFLLFQKIYSQEGKFQYNFQKSLVFKWNVSSLLDYTPSLQASIQYMLNKRFGIQHEIGVIHSILSPFWDADSYLSGNRFKNQLKFYFKPYFTSRNWYIALETMIKDINYYIERTYFFEFYRQKIPHLITKNVITFSFVIGLEHFLNKKGLLLDFYSGIGYRYLTILIDPPLIQQEWWVRNDPIIRKQGIYRLPNFLLGMRIGIIREF